MLEYSLIHLLASYCTLLFIISRFHSHEYEGKPSSGQLVAGERALKEIHRKKSSDKQFSGGSSLSLDNEKSGKGTANSTNKPFEGEGSITFKPILGPKSPAKARMSLPAFTFVN